MLSTGSCICILSTQLVVPLGMATELLGGGAFLEKYITRPEFWSLMTSPFNVFSICMSCVWMKMSSVSYLLLLPCFPYLLPCLLGHDVYSRTISQKQMLIFLKLFDRSVLYHRNKKVTNIGLLFYFRNMGFQDKVLNSMKIGWLSPKRMLKERHLSSCFAYILVRRKREGV